ncbi:tape measure protein [Acinetobacter entericus]|uniref:Tape measure protein n=1 Tax=Acinetobacter entericus TaxID=2989714 RepID=A0ABT3NN83_9GAMM|nr:tape measure protein [Acinetobacter entericus]MCW8041017.1 tape measure protein [Acinetobacter entericus]
MAQESVLRIVIDSRNAERNAHALANELESIGKKGDFATKSMDSMSVATRQLAGYMAGIVTISAAINKIDTYTGINNKLKLVTNSQEELNQAMQDTFAIAQRSASSWGAVNDVYSKYMSNAKTLNLTQEQTARLTEITSKAVAISGSTTESAAGALFQYGQALDGNILRGEEYNALVDGAGGLLSAMAKGLGITRGELRQMMLDGKLTGEVITKALLKAGDSVDELFNKTDVTIGQSLTVLSDSVTKFTGEAASGSGAATVLAGSIKVLAENLDLVANIAVVGGVAMLTKTVLAQTVAIQGSIAASAQRRAADIAALQSQVQLSAIEVQRTRQIAAQAISEVGLARQELNSATTRQARAAATMRLTQAEIALAIAQKQTKAATVEQIAAENALNASRAIGSRMLALVGGPIGAITLGVTALAAGYMYLQDRTAEANAKLEEQGKIAEKTDEELKKLSGNDKISAVNDLTAAFNSQNTELAKSKESVDAVLFAIRAASVENEKARKVTEDARNGVISYDEAIKRLNQMDIPTDLYDQLKKQVFQYNENAEKAGESQRALAALGKVVQLAGNLFQNSAVQVAKNTNELNKNESAAEKAAKAQAEFKKSLFDREFNAGLTKAMLDQGYNAEQINLISEYALKLQKEGKSITVEQVQYLLKINSIEEQNKKVIESRNAAEKERTKELEKQQKVLTASSKVQANAAKYNFTGLESKYGLPSGTLSAIHAIETGNTGKSNQVNGQTGATGGFQFLAGTAKQYGVKDRTDLAQSAEGAAKYMSYLLKLFKGDLEKAVRAYHAGEGNVQKGKNIGKYNNDYWQKFKGYTAGTNGFTAGDVGSKDWEKLLEEAAKMAEQQAELRKNLELNVASEVTRIRSKLADDLQEIDKAGYSPERAKEIKAEYQSRADNEIAIAEYALKTKLDDYSSFKKTEDELLKDSFDQKKFYAARDIELSKDQRDQAIKYLDEQYLHELGLIKLAKEQRIFQAEQAMYSEMDAIRMRYELEREEIAKTAGISSDEKVRRLSASQFNQKQDESDLTKSLMRDYMGVMGFEENPLIQQFEVLQKARENDLINEEEYQNAKLQLQAKSTASYMEGMFGGFAELVDENSKTYAVLFAAQKAFAVAQAMLNIPQAYSKAYDAVVGTPYIGPYIAPAIGAAAAALQVAQAASIKNVSMGSYATGGFTGIGGKFDPAGIVHKGEVVWSQEDIKRWGGVNVVEAMRTSQPPKGYSDGGLVTPKDTYRVGMGTVDAIERGANVQAERQAQANVSAQAASPQPIESNVRVGIFDDRDDMMNQMYGREGEKVVMYHLKRNGMLKA